MLPLLALHALAADETALPPALRGDVAVAFSSTNATWGLAEDTDAGAVRAGRRLESVQRLTFGATFAPVDGIAFTGGVEHAPRRVVRFRDARRMLADPATGLGSTAGGAPYADAPDFRGSGVLGWAFGVAFAPYSEERGADRPATWRLDLGFRSAPPRTLWERDGDRRGAGDGGPTFRARAAFSRTYAASSPYLVAAWEVSTPRFVTTADGWGEPAEVQVDPGQRVDVRGGVEVRLTRETDGPPTAFLDVSTGFSWQSAARAPSGFFLPDVLPASRGTAVVTAERLGWSLGLAAEIDLATPARLRLWSRGDWILPHRVEHPYKVWTTADSATLGLGAELVLRWR